MNTQKLIEHLREIAEKVGFHESGIVKTSDMVFDPAVRKMCADNVCRSYDTCWACPPAVGTLEECRQRCLQYDYLLLLSGKFELEDSFDFEGMMEGMAGFKRLIEAYDHEISPLFDRYQLFSNEGCDRCTSCTWPDAPCRFPEKVRHSIEGYGLNVSQLAAQAGMKYINGQNTITYFGGLMFCKSE